MNRFDRKSESQASTAEIKVAIVEDVEDIKWGLNYLIGNEQGFRSSMYANAEELRRDIGKDVPDVILMDIGLPGMNGIECTRQVKEKYPSIQIMMCTVYEDDEKIFEALKAGASGYIVKRTQPDKLIESIRDLHMGGSPMSSSIARKLVNLVAQKPSERKAEFDLSKREWEILDLLAQGFRSKEVADHLHISISTVKTHINHIYDKLHVTSRIEALNKIQLKR